MTIYATNGAVMQTTRIREGVYFGAAEAPALGGRLPATRAGTLRKFFAVLSNNTLDATCPVSVLIDGVATALSLSFAAGENATKSDLTTSVPIAQGQLISFLFDGIPASAGVADGRASVNLEAPGIGAIIGFKSNTSSTVNEAVWGAAAAFPNPSIRAPVTRAGDLRNAVVHVTSNDVNGPVVFTVLKNGVATPYTFTYVAAETGIKVLDLPGAVSVVDGDQISFKIDRSGATAGFAFFGIAVEIESPAP